MGTNEEQLETARRRMRVTVTGMLPRSEARFDTPPPFLRGDLGTWLTSAQGCG